MGDKIITVLENAGWYEGRKIDIDYVIDDLSQRGLTIPNILVKKLFEEYWNIKLEYITRTGQRGGYYLK
jgi:hypothetical protein